MKHNPSHPLQKIINSKCIKDVNVKSEIMTLFVEHIEELLQDISISNDYLDKTQNRRQQKEKQTNVIVSN
jgi:hypothetical protein